MSPLQRTAFTRQQGETMRVLVCGGRSYKNKELIRDVLKNLPHDATIVSGGAPGADHIAANEAEARGLVVEEYFANWKKYGVHAGPKRNKAMLDSGVDAVIAFTGGRGTTDMTRRAVEAGVSVVRPDIDGIPPDDAWQLPCKTSDA
jgi:predicted Rossmann-fold nucleotide-binding protein